jgi:hypothetical protein
MFGWTFEYTCDQPIQRLSFLVEDVINMKHGAGRDTAVGNEQDDFLKALGG